MNNGINLDERLVQLIEVTRQQGENITRLGQEQRESFAQSAQEQREQHHSLITELRELKEITRQQAEIAVSQQETIKQFASVFAQQARTISELSRSVQASVESSRQAAQAAAVVAQDNQNSIRDLIEELRQSR